MEKTYVLNEDHLEAYRLQFQKMSYYIKDRLPEETLIAFEAFMESVVLNMAASGLIKEENTELKNNFKTLIADYTEALKHNVALEVENKILTKSITSAERALNKKQAKKKKSEI